MSMTKLQTERLDPMKRRARTYAAAVGVATVGVLTLWAAPAFAGFGYLYLPDGAGYGHVDGSYASACDTRADNRGVVTEFFWNEGSSHTWDANGSSDGCGWSRASSDITWYRVCLQHEGSASIDVCTELTPV
jgi:hypothetical protein